MGNLEDLLKTKILEFAGGRLESVTPALKVQAFLKGKEIVNLSMGRHYKYFDLASLTKIFFSTLACMDLYDKDPAFLRRPLSEVLFWWTPKGTNAYRLLSHTAGLPWWNPFYENIATGSRSERWQELKARLSDLAPEKRDTAVYSDIDFLLLGAALEAFFDKGLYEIWSHLKRTKKLGDLHFNIENEPVYDRSLYAPTEDCPWRKKTLQGEVHDDNAWALKGVAPHAGLFGRIEDVSEFALRLRKLYYGGKDPLCSASTLQYFASRKTSKAQGDWGLGFMLPTEGKASCGRYFSSKSFGHTGFTGTSLWMDPHKDLVVAILSNRVCPSRTNSSFVGLRPLIHDWIYESCRG